MQKKSIIEILVENYSGGHLSHLSNSSWYHFKSAINSYNKHLKTFQGGHNLFGSLIAL